MAPRKEFGGNKANESTSLLHAAARPAHIIIPVRPKELDDRIKDCIDELNSINSYKSVGELAYNFYTNNIMTPYANLLCTAGMIVALLYLGTWILSIVILVNDKANRVLTFENSYADEYRKYSLLDACHLINSTCGVLFPIKHFSWYQLENDFPYYMNQNSHCQSTNYNNCENQYERIGEQYANSFDSNYPLYIMLSLAVTWLIPVLLCGFAGLMMREKNKTVAGSLKQDKHDKLMELSTLLNLDITDSHSISNVKKVLRSEKSNYTKRATFFEERKNPNSYVKDLDIDLCTQILAYARFMTPNQIKLMDEKCTYVARAQLGHMPK